MRVDRHWQHLPIFLSRVINCLCFFQSLKTVPFYFIQKTTKKEIPSNCHLSAQDKHAYWNMELYSRSYMYTSAITEKLERI